MSRQVCVIVVNWRLKEETLACLRSVEQLDVPCRIIVVDNGSADGSVEQIARYCAPAEIIALPANIGFAAACNRGIAHALDDSACEFVMLLNNDAVVHPQTIARLLCAAQAHPEAGILGPKVYCQDRPNVIWYAGAHRRRGVLLASDTGRGQIDHGQFRHIRSVDYVFGAAMLIRRSVLERVGVFDEQFFLYLEDLDFSLRAQRAGFKLLFVPEAHVWHAGSASSADQPEWRIYHLVRSSVLFLKKHAGIWFFPLMVVWFLATFKFTLAGLRQKRLRSLHHYYRGFVAGVAG